VIAEQAENIGKKLNEISKKYNFRFIMFFGEPAYIG